MLQCVGSARASPTARQHYRKRSVQLSTRSGKLDRVERRYERSAGSGTPFRQHPKNVGTRQRKRAWPSKINPRKAADRPRNGSHSRQPPRKMLDSVTTTGQLCREGLEPSPAVPSMKPSRIYLGATRSLSPSFNGRSAKAFSKSAALGSLETASHAPVGARRG